MIIRKAPAEIERMARAGAVVADTLALIGERAKPGVST
jgi:methionine aminopeptidase